MSPWGPDGEVGITWMAPKADCGLVAVGPRQRVLRPGVEVADLKFEIWLCAPV